MNPGSGEKHKKPDDFRSEVTLIMGTLYTLYTLYFSFSYKII